jgi:DNA-directed RNA polymerase specialized sigma24 family protein
MPNELAVDLSTRFVQGDLEAFETIFKQFEAEVYRWVLRIVRDPAGAEDVVVEAFWRAYRGRARFDPARSFGAWIRTIATNAARDYLRSARHRPQGDSLGGEIAAPPGADPGVTEAVALAFNGLPEKLRIVATLALIEDRPYTEIAEALGLPVGTVKSRVFRAIRLLRQELIRQGIRS